MRAATDQKVNSEKKNPFPPFLVSIHIFHWSFPSSEPLPILGRTTKKTKQKPTVCGSKGLDLTFLSTCPVKRLNPVMFKKVPTDMPVSASRLLLRMCIHVETSGKEKKKSSMNAALLCVYDVI